MTRPNLTQDAGDGRSIQSTIPPSPSTEDSQGFFMLPREIRDKIYIEVLRPDCSLNCSKTHTHIEHARKCTRLLQLSPRIYCEAIEMLHPDELNFYVNHRQRWQMRHAKDFGLPAQFISWKSTTAAMIPARFSELEITRMRKLCLTVEFGMIGNGNQPQYDRLDAGMIKKIGSVIEEIVKVIPKMTNLQHIRLRLRYQGHFEQDPNMMNVTSKQGPLKRLLSVIAVNKTKLILGPHEVWFNQDYLVESQDDMTVWLAKMVKDLRVNVSYAEDRGLPTGHLLKQRLEVPGGPEWISRVSSNSSLHYWSQDPDVGPHQHCIQSYQLVPECRTCLAVFKS